MRLGALTLTRRAGTVAVVYVLWEGRSCNVGVENLRSGQIVEQFDSVSSVASSVKHTFAVLILELKSSCGAALHSCSRFNVQLAGPNLTSGLECVPLKRKNLRLLHEWMYII